MCIAAAWTATPAEAAEVIVVEGDRTVRRDDPLVPSRSESDLLHPPGGASRPRTATSSSRPRSSPPATSARKRRPSRGRRAVGRALRRARQAGRISRARHNRYLRIYRRARAVRRRTKGARGRQLGYAIRSLEGMA